MSSRPHRLSDPTTALPVDAIVGSGSTRLREILRVDRFVGDLELNGSSSNTGPEKLEPKGTRGKDRLSDKYLAGLLDSDGSIQLMWNPPMRRENWDGTGPQRAYAVVSFHQKAPGRSFMELIASSLTPPSLEKVWGCFGIREYSGTHHWNVAGTKAVSVLMRLRKFLV